MRMFEQLEGFSGRYDRPSPWWFKHPVAKPRAKRDRGRPQHAAFVAHCRRYLAERFGLTRRQLYNLVWSEAVERVAARFGMSGNALRKTCKRYQIPPPPPGYWRNLEAKKPTKAFFRPPLGSLKAPKRQQPRWKTRGLT